MEVELEVELEVEVEVEVEVVALCSFLAYFAYKNLYNEFPEIKSNI